MGIMTTTQQATRFDAATIGDVARGQWPSTLASLGIEVGTGKHGPCPACGGKDRFRFDDKDGRGTHFCNQCGAGDGFRLIQKVTGLDFPGALRLVAGALGLGPTSHAPHLRPAPKPPRIDRVATAFMFDLAAFDHRQHADRILEAATGLDASQLDDEELEQALGSVAVAYRTRGRAELLEDVADDFRVKVWEDKR